METGRRDTGSLCKPLRSSKQPHWHVNPEGRKHADLAVPLITGQVFLASREGQLLAGAVTDGVVFDANAFEARHAFSSSTNLNAASQTAVLRSVLSTCQPPMAISHWIGSPTLYLHFASRNGGNF